MAIIIIKYINTIITTIVIIVIAVIIPPACFTELVKGSYSPSVPPDPPLYCSQLMMITIKMMIMMMMMIHCLQLMITTTIYLS